MLISTEEYLKYKKCRNREISSNSTCVELETRDDIKQVSNKQELIINQLRKHHYSKKQESCVTKKSILNPIEGNISTLGKNQLFLG